MDPSGYVILTLLGLELVTIAIAAVWIAVLRKQVSRIRADSCKTMQECLSLRRELTAERERKRLEELSNAEALADFNDRAARLPGTGGR